MKLEDIQKLWAEDSQMDRLNLDAEAVNIPKLHHKYTTLRSEEVLKLAKLKSEYNKLYLDKWEWYVDGAHKEGKEKGWKVVGHRIVKTEADKYLNADEDIIKLSLNISLQQEKSDFLKGVVDSINNRSFQINAATNFLKYTSGN